jgi:hypothetical protein
MFPLPLPMGCIPLKAHRESHGRITIHDIKNVQYKQQEYNCMTIFGMEG